MGFLFRGVTVQYLDAYSAVGPDWTPVTTPTFATAGTSSTCFDNGNGFGVAFKYSIQINSGTGANCALSFQFQ